MKGTMTGFAPPRHGHRGENPTSGVLIRGLACTAAAESALHAYELATLASGL